MLPIPMFGAVADAATCTDGCGYIRFIDVNGVRAIGHLGSMSPSQSVESCDGCMRWLHEPHADELGFEAWRDRREGVGPAEAI